MTLHRPAPLAAALLLLAGCAATPPPRPLDDVECRVIPTGMVECQPRQADGAATPGGR